MAISAGAAGVAAAGMGMLGSSSSSLIGSAANVKLARENRQWMEHMSSTQYQRAMADLKAAGVNPMLAAMGGMGAGAPSSSPASVDLQTGAGEAAGLIFSALSAKEQRQMQREVNEVSMDKMKADAKVSQETAKTQAAQRDLLAANAAEVKVNTRLKEFDAYKSDIKSSLARKVVDMAKGEFSAEKVKKGVSYLKKGLSRGRFR